jgi:transposase-like protein
MPDKRNRFAPIVVQQAVSLFPNFRLSLRGVEELLAQRRPKASRQTSRAWMVQFHSKTTANMRRRKL